MIKINLADKTSAAANYRNDEAFQEACSMASRFEKFNIIFDIINGVEVIKIESKSTSRFILQLNEGILRWLFHYVIGGENENMGIDSMQISPSDEANGNSYRKHMLMFIAEQKIARSIQVTPEFRERTSGQFTAVANFMFGTIFFYMDRDDEIKEWLEARQTCG